MKGNVLIEKILTKISLHINTNKSGPRYPSMPRGTRDHYHSTHQSKHNIQIPESTPIQHSRSEVFQATDNKRVRRDGGDHQYYQAEFHQPSHNHERDMRITHQLHNRNTRVVPELAEGIQQCHHQDSEGDEVPGEIFKHRQSVPQ